ncbi:polysaccharide biosynthesis tyrosine autokinase [uncultured Thiodictyon sp.]|uniref:GumC family protein n=1 Tax=uncultured Thiodictyon sp. TaxID=1846217 RepID=UPI0025E1ADA4|nr:polysaccharide biosynthesis tyrosine autokinase [uncultured Thiodictyon sp.]
MAPEGLHQAGAERLRPAPPGEDDGIDLLRIWYAVYRHKVSILLLALLTVMVTTLVVYSQTPIYQSTATLLIEPSTSQVVSIKQVYGAEAGSNDYLQTQFELIRSRSLAERVVRDLKLNERPEFDPRQRPAPALKWPDWLNVSLIQRFLPTTRPADLREPEVPAEDKVFEAVVSAFMSRVTVAPKRGTQLATIGVEMASSVMAAQAANALAQGYIDSQFEARLGLNQAAASWMTNRVAELKANLQASEQRLQQYREKENLVDLEGVTTLSGQELTQVGTRMVELRRELASVENQYKQIERMKGAGWERLAAVPVVAADSMVRQFRAEEARARAKVEELSRRYGPKHPAMAAARTDLESAQVNLRNQVEQVVGGIERSYQLAIANEASVRGSFQQNKSEIQDIKRKEFTFRELQREVESNRTLYDTFMTRLKETSAVSDLQAANARIVDRAIVPKAPVRPKKGQIIAIAGLLALLAGIGLALLREQLDNRVHGPAAVEARLHLPTLGILPLQKKNERIRMANLYLDDTDKAFSESVRSIRTGVVLSGLDNPHKIIVVTSSVPGEGKTSLACNLAFSLGQVDKVLLIEADMRRPTFKKLFELPAGTPGLANVVAGTAELTDAVRSVGTIDLLGCGTLPPNPLELLSTQRFVQLLGELAERYDRIVIDTPPVQVVSDALVLATYASTVIFVIKSEATPFPIIAKGIKQLQQLNAPLAGVVLNQVNVRKATKYGYGYGSGRYAYGGYGGYYDYYGYSKETRA